MFTKPDQIQLTPNIASEIHGDIAVLVMDNPPVNGINDEVRKGLLLGIEQAQLLDVRAVVITGSGNGFSGGADIRQFNTKAAQREPSSRQVVTAIENSKIPVIAAIHGFCLGGGLELALGCHYRIAEWGATIGLPETTLGLIPGGGGTQRLPRLIGVEPALDAIMGARKFTAQKALELDLIDELFSDSSVDAGIAFARSLPVAEHQRVIDLPTAGAESVDFGARRTKVRPNARNARALLAAIDAVEASLNLPVQDGLDFERKLFDELVEGPESKALRHVFRAERAAAKFPSGTAKVRPVKSVAVVGSGTMGTGIAMACADAGLTVTVIDLNDEALRRGKDTVTKNFAISSAKGRFTGKQVEECLASITFSSKLEDAGSVDVVIEAVFEDLDVKREVFRKLDAICAPGTVLATNTSRLDVNLIAEATSRPADVVGLHFFSPANVMRLLEIARSDTTSDEVLRTALAFASTLGKVPVVVRVCEGFVGNRMLSPYWREAWFLLEEGASPQQVDAALTGFGMAMGPLAMADLAGLDINWAARKRLESTRRKDLRYPHVADRICEAGRFGQKTGAGYYRYEQGERLPIPDETAVQIIEATSAELGIARRPVTGEEIAERCILSLVNEGAKILEDGIVRNAADIDVVYVNGYGFPARLGGPLYYAEQLGLARVLDKINNLEATHGEHWTPAPLLQRLVAGGQTTFNL